MRTVAVDHSERPDEVSMNYARQNECSEVKKTIRLPRKHGERSLKTVIQGEENSEVYDPAENHPLSYLIDDYLVDTDPIELPASNPDWTFLQPVEGTAFPDCPSLASGSTVSSRNSSTRSTKSLRWHGSEYMLNGDAEPATGERCPMPDCNRVFKDLKCHLLTHRTERPEKCPVETCEYHVKGFARAYDRMRHTCTHFRGTMTCGFCADSGDTAQIHYNNVYVFSRHLTSVHKVTQVSAARRAQLLQRTTTANTVPQPSPHTPSATCTMCSEPFDAQGFYEHLLGCVLRQVTRDLVDVQENRQVSQEKKAAHRNAFIITDENLRLSTPTEASFHLSEPVTTALEQVVPRDEDSTECREIAELTASSRCLSLTSSSNEIGSSGEETDWTEDAGSPESEVDVTSVRPILSPVKQRLVDRIMTEFHRLFDQSHSNNRTHNGSNPSSSAYRPGISSSGSSTYSSASFISRKRSLSGGGSPPPNEDGDDTHKRRRPDSKLSNGKQPVPELRFACPYYKRNPGRHQTFTSCRDPGFITVARLKEHLYRRHLLPIQCHRCCATFTNEPNLREHQRDLRGCEIREQIPLEGFNKDQERKLKSKRRSLVYQSEEDKWKIVYRILFPDDSEIDMPSPYISYQPHTGAENEPSNIARFQEFSRLELPRLVRRTLEVVVEEEAQPLEDKMKDRLVEIVKECQTQLLSMFQSAGSSSSSVATANVPEAGTEATTNDGWPHIRTDLATNMSFSRFDFLNATATQSSATASAPQDTFTKHDVSDSPDSGYDSTYNYPSLPAIHIPQDMIFATDSIAFQQDPAFHQTTFDQAAFEQGISGNEHVDLGGYYGLFENQNASASFGIEDLGMDASAMLSVGHSYGTGIRSGRSL